MQRELTAELDAFRRFAGVLESEQDALANGDPERLMEFARLKTEAVDELSRMGRQRGESLKAAGFGADRGGMESWLKQNDRDGRLAALWRELTDIARRCQHLNQVNGAMIQTQLQHNRKALDVLQQAAGQVSVYGPDGLTYGPRSSRNLGEV